MQLIDTCLPLIITLRERGLDSQELSQLSEGFERYFERDQPYAVLNVSHVEAPSVDARSRMQVAAWANQARVQDASRRLCAGTATVVARAWERRAMTAIQWLWTPTAPHQAVGTVPEGIAYCIARLVERGVRLPVSPEAFGARLDRVLSTLPVAGRARESGSAPHDSASWSKARLDARASRPVFDR